jgi:hypothetical protein
VYSWRHLAAAMANKAAQAMLGWPEAYVPVPALSSSACSNCTEKPSMKIPDLYENVLAS